MSRSRRNFRPKIDRLESIISPDGAPIVPGLPNPLPPGYPPADPGPSNLDPVPTPPPNYDPLAPVLVVVPNAITNMEDGTVASTSVQ